MKLLERIFKSLIMESVSVNDVSDAIDRHERIIINYHSDGMDSNTGARVIEVYGYGLTKAGNPVIRAWQPYGDTTTTVPHWKFFRLDRISAWKPTGQFFSEPASDYYKGYGDFNPNGDDTMSVVYKLAKFDNMPSQPETTPSEPKTKQDIYRTDTEKKMERFKQQMRNPIKLSDIKTGDAFKQLPKEEKPKSGPKTKQDVYKTDTERNMERMRQQMQNPRKIDLSQFDKKEKSPEEKERDLQNLRDVLGDKTMSLSDLNKELSKKNEPYKTDTERNMERMRQQMQNPRKIDLSKIPEK